MLVLGIESATTQVGCAIGGHEGVLASAHSSRAKRHAEILTPQIDFVRRQARIVQTSKAHVRVSDRGTGCVSRRRKRNMSAFATAIA